MLTSRAFVHSVCVYSVLRTPYDTPCRLHMYLCARACAKIDFLDLTDSRLENCCPMTTFPRPLFFSLPSDPPNPCTIFPVTNEYADVKR